MISVIWASVYLMGDGLPFYRLNGIFFPLKTQQNPISSFSTTNIKSIGFRFMPLKVILSICYSG